MATEDDTAQKLIDHLLQLHADHDEKTNHDARGKLANLRYALRDRLNSDYPDWRVIPALEEGCLPEDPTRYLWYTLVAALFGFAHDEVANRNNVSLGTAFRDLYEDRKTESTERRFMALLSADAEHLPGHLRHTISLLKTPKDKPIGLGWKMLLYDVCHWSEPDKRVQKRWIRDYYRPRRAADDRSAPNVNEIPTAEQGE